MSIRSEAIMSVRGHRGRTPERPNFSQAFDRSPIVGPFSQTPAPSLRNCFGEPHFRELEPNRVVAASARPPAGGWLGRCRAPIAFSERTALMYARAS